MTMEFDPPLCIPGNGGAAHMEVAGDFRPDGQPSEIQVEVCDGSNKRLAFGLFEHVGNGLYRLIDGSACTGDAKTGMRIERASPSEAK